MEYLGELQRRMTIPEGLWFAIHFQANSFGQCSNNCRNLGDVTGLNMTRLIRLTNHFCPECLFPEPANSNQLPFNFQSAIKGNQ